MYVLVFDPDCSSARLIAHLLTDAGYQVLLAHSVAQVVHLLAHALVDLVLLEVQLPDSSGFDVCQRIRRSSDVPIIFLTTRTQVADRVQGLQYGADDYVGKPFDPLELLARVHAVLRRVHPADEHALLPLSRGSLTLQPIAYQVVRADDSSVALTPREFQLLHYLMTNAGHALSVQQIMVAVWGNDFGWQDTNVVATYINRLRRKLEPDVTHPQYIQTVRDAGYMFVADLASRSVGGDY
jgi:DNA-binding response OmpR family regulator